MSNAFLPQEDYSTIKHRYSLIDPVINSLDKKLKEIAQAFSKTEKNQRNKIIVSLSSEEIDTLLMFGKRVAVFALRGGSADWINAGLAACAMIDVKRMDYRDLYTSLGLLRHAIEKLNLNAEEIFRQTALLGTPESSKIMIHFAENVHNYTLYSWGYDEIETKNGVGLIWRWNDNYSPTYNLKKIGLELFDLIDKDREYIAQKIIVGGFPKVWLKTEDNEPDLNGLEHAMRGCILVDGILAPDKYPHKRNQTLTIRVIEMENKEQAKQLAIFAAEKKPTTYVMEGIKTANLFCLVTARSIMKEVENFETQESIKRFSKGINEILVKYTGI